MLRQCLSVFAVALAACAFNSSAMADNYMNNRNDGGVRYYSPRIEGFAAGVFFGGNGKSTEAQSWYNGGSEREGDVGDIGAIVGGTLRYYDVRVLNHPVFINIDLSNILSDSDKNLFARYHFGAGNDTGVRISESWRTRIGGGFSLFEIQEMEFWGVGGLQLSDLCFTGKTDETSGAGIRNRFKDDDGLAVGGYFGMEMSMPLAEWQERKIYLNTGFTASVIGSREVEGRSTLGGNYRFQTGSIWDVSGTAGIMMQF